MDSPTTTKSTPSHSSSVQSREPLDSPNSRDHQTSSPQSTTPLLGDFSKLHASVSTLSSSSLSEGPAKLGNFSKVFERMKAPQHLSRPSSLTSTVSLPSSCTASTEEVDKMAYSNYYPAYNLHSYIQQPAHAPDFPLLKTVMSPLQYMTLPQTLPQSQAPQPWLQGTYDRVDYSSSNGSAASTPPTTPPSAAEDPVAQIGLVTEYQKLSIEHATIIKASVESDRTEGNTREIAYKYSRDGQIRTIRVPVRRREAAHRALSKKLIEQGVIDGAVALDTPETAENGIHVFLDMSNINISFLSVLRAKYGLAESARFVGLPQMNLAFLHELLVRRRPIKKLNVGCSMHPNRAEPAFVQTFRDLDYTVDLRYRRPEGEHMVRDQLQCGYSSDEVRYTVSTRYVEDMVDETLQTRIGESVMEYHNEKGTLVLVTGDARPAKFSDGFFKYAERALGMGWNVEVISWKCSLSMQWRNPEFTRKWGSRFRVIELDNYLDELFGAYI